MERKVEKAALLKLLCVEGATVEQIKAIKRAVGCFATKAVLYS